MNTKTTKFFIIIIIILSIVNVYFLYNLEIIKIEKKYMNHKYIEMIESEGVRIQIKNKIEGIIEEISKIRKKNNLSEIYYSDEDIDDIVIELLVGDIYRKIDYNKVIALISAESFWQPNAKSIKSARGLMQIMPDTHLDMCDKLNIINGDIYNVKENVMSGIKYIEFVKFILEYGTESYPGLDKKTTPENWVIAYNAGHTRYLREKLWKNIDRIPEESRIHYLKWKYYYTNYQNGNYNVWYYDRKSE